jgi:chromosome segregation ATPase
MSKPKPSGQAAEIAAKGFGSAGLTLHVPQPVLGREAPPAEDPAPIAELIARFQLETESAIAGLRREQVAMVEGLERRVAGLQDDWSRTRGEVAELKRTVEDAIHQMRQSVAECINAQRESAGSAQRAERSAQVFDKLKASQPDFHRMVAEQNKTIAATRDELVHVRERVTGLEKRLDDFDVVAEDYEETKGAVRGMDLIVKDLRGEAQQRRQVGGR